MNGEPVVSRTWIDPAWGELLHRIQPYVPVWRKSAWYQHLGLQTLVWSGLLLCIGLAGASIEVVVGTVSLATAADNLFRLELFGILLGSGMLIALVDRWYQSKYGHAMLDVNQGEIYTNGIYLEPYGFVGGLHPFFYWNEIRAIEPKKHKGRVELLLQLRHLPTPGTLQLDLDITEELLQFPGIGGGADSLLANALKTARDALAKE